MHWLQGFCGEDGEVQRFVDLFIDGYFAAQGCAFVEDYAHTFAAPFKEKTPGYLPADVVFNC